MDRITGNKLFLYTQKNGRACPLRPAWFRHSSVGSSPKVERGALATDPTAQPMAVALALNFPTETLELVLNMFGVNQKQESYTKARAACYYSVLIGYFCNGFLRVFNAATGERLSHKTAFVAVNVDRSATAEGWKQKIKELEAE